MNDSSSNTVPPRRSLWRRPKFIIPMSIIALAAILGGTYGYLRVGRTNFYAVADGRVYRSAQPDPKTLQKWIGQYQLKTILNLRGAWKEWDAEQQVARQASVDMIDIRLSATRQPPIESLRRLVTALETAKQPMLIHCQAGADRTGLASVMAAMAIGGQDYRAARSQMSAKYLHFDNAPDHIVGVLTAYEDYCRGRGIDTAGWSQFRKWAMEEYHPDYFNADIAVPAELRAGPGQALPLKIKITNRASRAIPAGDSEKTITLAAFTPGNNEEEPLCEYGARAELPQKDIKPGESAEVALKLLAPRTAGTYAVSFDLVDEGNTWFSRQGSPVSICRLIVGDAASAATRPTTAGSAP